MGKSLTIVLFGILFCAISAESIRAQPATSATATITLVSPSSFSVALSELQMPIGRSGTFTVELNKKPEADISITTSEAGKPSVDATYQATLTLRAL